MPSLMPASVPAPARLFSLLLAVVVSIGAERIAADEPSEDALAFFETQIRPALIEHCAECHWGDTEASGGLLLDSKQGWLVGGDLGPAIVPGDLDSSLLIKAIEYEDPNLEMPPDGKLDQTTIAAFRHWIQAGAVDPRQAASSGPSEPAKAGLPVSRAQEHWAYRPIDAAPQSDIDALIDRRIRQSGLVASPPADRRQLVRRLVFDLHGLPPSAETIDAFLADESPLAYEHLVDHLLASPRFAEHFARRWMDVVRYAESITLRGFILPEAWRYRDYLVNAYAQDRPFDQMIRDQIAGDLLPADDLSETQQRAIATGFLAMGNSNLEDQDKTKLEFDHIDEQLETMGRAFLAQTIGCARCHDHKFDPIPTRDYYALAGIMRSTTPLMHANLSKWIEKPLPLDHQIESHYRELESKIDEVTAELAKLKRADRDGGKESKSAVPIESLAGIVIDDTDASFVGEWTESNFVKPFVGAGYQHDGTAGQGSKSVTFDPPELESGQYEVRMSYTAHDNRATNVRVKVFSANESATIIVNERKQPPDAGLWISLGVFPFEKQGQSFVIVSNEDANGCVVVDAIQFLPVENRGQAIAATQPLDRGETENAKAIAERVKKTALRIKKLEQQLKRLQAELDARPKYLTVSESEPVAELAIRIRGNVHQLGDRVPRGFLTAIGPAEQHAQQIGSAGSGRVELADWIADPQNPLTARVYANRVWSWLMGEGLVATENNFGTTGQPPSHPQLLDHLASELIAHEWSTKHLVRTIVHSDAYRRSLTEDPNRIAMDPNNRLYASGKLKRIPVEAIRDAMLCVSGELEERVGGSLIRHGTKSDYNYRHDSNRRSLYLPVFRNSLPPLFKNFDFADASVSVGQRSRSTVAPQSLAMMHHAWIIERAKRAALHYQTEQAGKPTEQLVHRLYIDCFGRSPDAVELRLCLEYLQTDKLPIDDDRLADLIQSLFASIDFRYLE